MSATQSSLGVCPHCGSTVLPSQILIEYRRGDGSVGIYAGCRSCDDVIRPE
jgi:hypothetical protein